VQVRLTDFAAHALKLTEQLKDASLSLARQSGRPVQYLTSAASNKEDVARGIAFGISLTRESVLARFGRHGFYLRHTITGGRVGSVRRLL
jgi:hypothetical protein